jgi:hypothetical protein
MDPESLPEPGCAGPPSASVSAGKSGPSGGCSSVGTGGEGIGVLPLDGGGVDRDAEPLGDATPVTTSVQALSSSTADTRTATRRWGISASLRRWTP